MRIAIIGGGLFGCTVAIHAARSGLETHLFEAKDALMCGASASTYSRLHRGAHYPRSPETGRESRRAEKTFRAEYGEAVIDSGRQLYIVANGGHVTVSQYRDFLDTEGLSFSEENGIFAVVEPRINLGLLQAIVREKIRKSGATIHFGTRVTKTIASDLRRRFDIVAVAAYAQTNEIIRMLGCQSEQYRFQIVEKPVVKVPEHFKDTSIVVIDGPFGCIDPLDDTPYHVLGHAVHTIHASNTGLKAVIPEHLRPVLDIGLIGRPHCTRVKDVTSDLDRYIPGIGQAEYRGSMFTVRAVLAHHEHDDARPTLVQAIGDRVIRVFSGKLGTACRAAQDVLALLGQKTEMAA